MKKKDLSLARCEACSKLFLIYGKDPGWLRCHLCLKEKRKCGKISYREDSVEAFTTSH